MGNLFRTYVLNIYCRSINTHHIHEVPDEKLKKLKQRTVTQNVDPTEGNKGKNRNTTSRQQRESTDRLKVQSATDSDKDKISKQTEVINKGKSTQHGVASNDSVGESRLKYRYDDSLEMDILRGPLHHEPAKLITVEESVKVLERQHELHKVRLL